MTAPFSSPSWSIRERSMLAFWKSGTFATKQRYNFFVGFETFLSLLFVYLNAVIRLPSCFQISRLEKDKEDLVAHYQGADPMRDGKRAEALLREKTQLLLRLKGLEAEVTELRAQKENSGQQAESVQRIQIRQLSESQAALKALEVRLNAAACWSFCYGASTVFTV